MIEKYNALQESIQYKFKSIDLLIQALTHSSYSNETGGVSFERLEFLGDAVIELVVSDYIYREFNLDSGLSSRLRAGLVSTEYLCVLAEKLNLPSIMQKSKSLSTISHKTKADLFESLIGAMYLDGGLKVAESLIFKLIIVDKNNVENTLKTCIDSKTKVQETMQSLGKKFEYSLVESKGQDHQKIFVVNLSIDGKIVSRESGHSIHEAEEKCAKTFLDNNGYWFILCSHKLCDYFFIVVSDFYLYFYYYINIII